MQAYRTGGPCGFYGNSKDGTPVLTFAGQCAKMSGQMVIAEPIYL